MLYPTLADFFSGISSTDFFGDFHARRDALERDLHDEAVLLCNRHFNQTKFLNRGPGETFPLLRVRSRKDQFGPTIEWVKPNFIQSKDKSRRLNRSVRLKGLVGNAYRKRIFANLNDVVKH